MKHFFKAFLLCCKYCIYFFAMCFIAYQIWDFSLDEWRFTRALDERLEANEIYIPLAELADFEWDQVCQGEPVVRKDLWALTFITVNKRHIKVYHLPKSDYRSIKETPSGMGYRIPRDAKDCVPKAKAFLQNDGGKVFLINREWKN